MKIAVTIADFGAAANIGGPIEMTTSIIEVDKEQIPPALLRYLALRKKAQEEAKHGKRSSHYCSIMLSLVENE